MSQRPKSSYGESNSSDRHSSNNVRSNVYDSANDFYKTKINPQEAFKNSGAKEYTQGDDSGSDDELFERDEIGTNNYWQPKTKEQLEKINKKAANYARAKEMCGNQLETIQEKTVDYTQTLKNSPEVITSNIQKVKKSKRIDFDRLNELSKPKRINTPSSIVAKDIMALKYPDIAVLNLRPSVMQNPPKTGINQGIKFHTVFRSR